ncbi:hypothetical protein ACG0Z6_05740 [Roseateles sp. BYS180W]|uniref:Lipoprotein n=1 Tax=Roseateles rivi TaxID=3299028 RepID=A0ABW7FU03_9BURK
MDMRYSSLALLIVMSLGLQGCALWRGKAEAAPAVTAPARAPQAAAVKTTTDQPQSPYAFEAERAGLAVGCQGNASRRPETQLLSRDGVLDTFELSCKDGRRLTVRCDTGMCRVQTGV